MALQSILLWLSCIHLHVSGNHVFATVPVCDFALDIPVLDKHFWTGNKQRGNIYLWVACNVPMHARRCWNGSQQALAVTRRWPWHATFARVTSLGRCLLGSRRRDLQPGQHQQPPAQRGPLHLYWLLQSTVWDDRLWLLSRLLQPSQLWELVTSKPQ